MMCLAIPGQVIEIDRKLDPLMGRVDFGGITKQICLEFIPHVAIGEYVLVHVGFALARIDESEAEQIFSFLRSMQEPNELGDDAPATSEPAAIDSDEQGIRP